MMGLRDALRYSISVLALYPAIVMQTMAQEAPPPSPALDLYDFTEEADVIWELPRRLREISGLALSVGGRLLAHDDELAIVYEFDYLEGELVKAFAFGDRTATADFEGIARTGSRVYLLTSDGRLYEADEGNDGDRLLYNIYGTSAGRWCELEGLTLDHASEHLIMICKTPRDDRLEDLVSFYRWSLETRSMAQDSLVTMPLLRFTARMDDEDEDEFEPSGIARHPNGNYIIISAAQSAIAEITPSGAVVAFHEFEDGAHDQVEGIEIGSNGALFLADEGRRGRARISIYRPRPTQ